MMTLRSSTPYAYGFADMIYYCWLCDRIPLTMEERHPSFLFKAQLVAPDCAMYGIPDYWMSPGSTSRTGAITPMGRTSSALAPTASATLCFASSPSCGPNRGMPTSQTNTEGCPGRTRLGCES
ncbi:MAG: hypothetical protein ABFE08_16375 [Armatimonadia bacterium]